MPRSDSICLIFTRRFGATTSSFISASKSVPPARIEPCSPRRVATCSFFVGLTYSNACMGASLLQGLQNAVGRERQEGHAHADGIRDGVGDGRTGRDHRRLGQADDTALVVTLAGHHVYLQFADIGDSGQAIELHV